MTTKDDGGPAATKDRDTGWYWPAERTQTGTQRLIGGVRQETRYAAVKEAKLMLAARQGGAE